MKALIVVAHGSRRKESNEEVINFVDALSISLKNKFSIVNYAFLEFSTITIESVIDETFIKGAKEITIFPLFISAGKHVRKDIPLAVGNALAKHPKVKVELIDHLGAQEGLLNYVSEVF